MDSDDYYDSLEEDSNYGSLDGSEEPSIKSKYKNPSKIPVKTKIRSRQKEIKASFTQEDDIIPYYNESLSKSEVELRKMFLKQEWDANGQKSKQEKKFSKKKIPVPDVKAKFKSTSYLDMFYAKKGVEKINLSTRATCEDLSPKSYTTCEDLELATSVYLSEIESIYSSQNAKIAEDLSLSLTSFDSQFCSVSQVNNYVVNNIKPKIKKIAYARPNNGTKVPELGRLGPEIPKDKLELLKKRQDYGQKVSKKNKIKMIERKLLQNLQQEIKECKKIT